MPSSVWVRVAATTAIAALIGALLWPLMDRSPEPTIERARMTWYGVYAARHDGIVKDESDLKGRRIVSTGIEPPAIDSDRIPAVLDSRFGFGFELTGRPGDAWVALRFVREFPAGGIVDTASGERHTSEQSEFRIRLDQKELFVGYSFDAPYQLVPGDGTLELWRGDRKLLAKSFTVYFP